VFVELFLSLEGFRVIVNGVKSNFRLLLEVILFGFFAMFIIGILLMAFEAPENPDIENI